MQHESTLKNELSFFLLTTVLSAGAISACVFVFAALVR
jgi:hypothetical protein